MGRGDVVGMEGDSKVKQRRAHTTHTHTHTESVSLSESASAEHQSLLDMVGGHTSERFTL